MQLRIDAAARCRCLGKKNKAERGTHTRQVSPSCLPSGTGTSCARAASSFPHARTCPAFVCPPCFLPCSLRCGFGFSARRIGRFEDTTPTFAAQLGTPPTKTKIHPHTHTRPHNTTSNVLSPIHTTVCKVDDCSRPCIFARKFLFYCLFSVIRSCLPSPPCHPCLLACFRLLSQTREPPPFPHHVSPIHSYLYMSEVQVRRINAPNAA